MSSWTSYFPIVRERVRRQQFRSLFLFVTSRCNSLCRTCFYFDKLNSRDDMTVDQIRRISETAGPFEKLWLSGGEPFLRNELADIVTMFVRNNGVKNVNLPTNGLLGERIFAGVEQMLRESPEVVIDLNFSLDGLANTHDTIRGVPNNFRKTLAVIAEADKRWRNHKRVRRNVVSVITRENYYELIDLAKHIAANDRSSGHYFEIVRGQAPDPTLKNLTREQVVALHAQLMPIHRHYASKLFAHLPPLVRQFATMYYLGNLRLHFDLHEKNFERSSAWPMPCSAGKTTIVIDHNGRFRACELRDTIGALEHFDFDLGAALASEEMARETASIDRDKCWCTHSCFIQESSKFAPSVQLFTIPWAWMKSNWRRMPEITSEELKPYRSLEVA